MELNIYKSVRLPILHFTLMGLLAFFGTGKANALHFEEGGIYYNIISEDNFELEVTGGDETHPKLTGEVVIPDTVMYEGNTYTVTGIGDWAFNECYEITSVVIPETVTFIGENAFNDCQEMTQLNIPEGITSIGSNAFLACYKWEGNVNLPYLTTIEDGVFAYCRSLKSAVIGNSVTSIGTGAFSWCEVMTELTIGEAVDSIGIQAFEHCESLTSVEIPDNVKYIGDRAFADCWALETLTLGESVSEIGIDAFSYCTSLITTTCYAIDVPQIGNTCFYNIPESAILYIPSAALEDYKSSEWAQYFLYVLPIGSEPSEINSLSLNSIESSVVKQNSDFNIIATITNMGNTTIEKFGYTVKIGTINYSDTCFLDFPFSKYGSPVAVAIPCEAISEVGEYDVEISIGNVNGEINQSDSIIANSKVTIIPNITVRPLVEDYEGLWCGWCPRGYVGMDAVNAAFADDAVIITYHNNDPMEVTTTYPLLVDAFPSATINRGEFIDPYYGNEGYNYDINLGILNTVNNSIAEAFADIEITDIKVAGDFIMFTTKSSFYKSLNDANLQIGFVLTANGLSGSNWSQSNYYNDYYNDETDSPMYKGTPMDFYVMGSNYVFGLEYNYVALNVEGMMGIENSLPSEINFGDELENSFNLYLGDIPSIPYSLEQCVINCFIIDKTTGAILNANKMSLIGVEVNDENVVAASFDMAMCPGLISSIEWMDSVTEITSDSMLDNFPLSFGAYPEIEESTLQLNFADDPKYTVVSVDANYINTSNNEPLVAQTTLSDDGKTGFVIVPVNASRLYISFIIETNDINPEVVTQYNLILSYDDNDIVESASITWEAEGSVAINAENENPVIAVMANNGQEFEIEGLIVDNALVFEFSDLAAGTYTITVPEGYVTIGEDAINGELEFEVTIELPSGISGITADGNGLYRVYDLTGRNLVNTKDVNVVKSLRRGLYIINGKKVAI